MEKGRRINTEKSTRKEKRVKNKKAKKVINIVIGIVSFIIICLIANNYIVFDKNKTSSTRRNKYLLFSVLR